MSPSRTVEVDTRVEPMGLVIKDLAGLNDFFVFGAYLYS